MRRIIRYVGCGVTVLSLGGCWWPMPGAGPNRQANNAAEDQITVATVAGLEEVWTAAADSGAVGDPVTSVRGVHVNDATSVYGFATGSGDRLWAYQPSGIVSMEQPYVSGEEVWASALGGGQDGVGPAVVLDAATGAPLDTVVGDQALAALSADYAVFWGRSITSTIDVLDRETSTWVCCGELLFGAAGTRPRWPVTLGSDMFFDAGFGLTHTQIDNIGNGVRRYRIDPPLPCSWITIGMCPLWVTPLDGTDSVLPVLSDDQATVYVGTNAGTVYAVDTTTGAILWSAAVGSRVTDSPALANGSLYVPTEANGVVALAAGGCGTPSCSPLWTAPTASAVTQQPAAAGGLVFAGTADGMVVAFDADGCPTAICDPSWSASTGSEITGAPTVSNGQLYIGTADGRLIAYGQP